MPSGPLPVWVRLGAGSGLLALTYACLVAWARGAWLSGSSTEELEAHLRAWMSELGLSTSHHYLRSPAGMVHVLEAGAGPEVVVLLPGLAASAGEFGRLIKALAVRHRVLAIDRPGTGLSDPAEFPGHPQGPWISVIAAVADQLGLAEFVLVGHSVGGLAAGGFAATHPERVRRLILLSPLGLGPAIPLSWNLMLLPGMAQLVGAGDRLRRILLVGRQPGASGRSPMRQYRLGVGLRFGPGSDFGLLPRLLRPFGLRRQSLLLPGLAEVAERTTVVWGSEDREISLTGARRALRRHPAIALKVVEGEGHSLPFAKPGLLAKLIGTESEPPR